jgi:hypothetical protein
VSSMNPQGYTAGYKKSSGIGLYPYIQFHSGNKKPCICRAF